MAHNSNINQNNIWFCRNLMSHNDLTDNDISDIINKKLLRMLHTNKTTRITDKLNSVGHFKGALILSYSPRQLNIDFQYVVVSYFISVKNIDHYVFKINNEKLKDVQKITLDANHCIIFDNKFRHQADFICHINQIERIQNSDAVNIDNIISYPFGEVNNLIIHPYIFYFCDKINQEHSCWNITTY